MASAGRVTLSVFLALFAGVALANGLDRVSGRAMGVARAVPWPFRAQADRSAAALDLARQQAAPALVRAVAAVSEDPLDRDATALLGSARLAGGDDDGAAAAFRVAARFGWRNIATQLYWYDAALQVGDYRVAADRADAILRVDPGFAPFNELMQPLEENQSGRANLLDHLAARPPWTDRYLYVDTSFPEAVIQRRAQVIEQAGGQRRPLGCKQVFAITSTFIQRGERDEAVRLWNANCPGSPVTQAIADSDFEHVDRGDASPFGWQVLRTGDVAIAVVSGPRGGKELAIENHAPNVQLALQQAVAFPAGKYRLRAAVHGEGAAPANQLIASVGCDRPPFPALASGDLSGPGQVVVIPACKRLLLGIWVRPGGAAARLDSLQVKPAN